MTQRTCSIEGCDQSVHARGWCNMHYLRWWSHGDTDERPTPTISERFWSYVDKDGPIPEHRPDLGPCWIWKGARSGTYGTFYDPTGPYCNVLAHRWSWAEANGPIPNGLDNDHLCRIRLCVRPSHLEPVTTAENLRRGLNGIMRTHCRAGHLLDGHNIIWSKNGRKRKCRICVNAQARERYANGWRARGRH